MLLDAGAGDGAAQHAAGHQAEGSSCDGHGSSTGNAQVLDQGTEGTSGTVTADHGDGTDAQAQTRIQTEGSGHAGAQHVLQEDQHNGDRQEDDNLDAALLQQLEAGHKANAAEEHGHEEALQGAIKADGGNSGSVQAQVNQSVHDAAHHGGGDAVVAQQGDLAHDEATQQQHDCRNGSCMVHVQIDFQQVTFSSFL